MRKILSVLMLLAVLGLSGCIDRDALDGGYDDSQIEQNDPMVEQGESEQEEQSLHIGPREFDVASGEHGYLGVQWLEHMNDDLPNRLAFTDRELETAEWLVETLLEMGFDESQVDMQMFNYADRTSSWWGPATMMVEWYESMGYYDGLERLDESQNVILTLPGRSEETIIIGAHYDGVGYPGISDNAGGTVLLLENTYRMKDMDHYYTLQYVFFGAEEVGLIGAFHFVDQMSQEEVDNLVLMINADVIMDGPELVYAVAYIDEMPAFPMDLLWELPTYAQNETTAQIEEIASRLNADNQTELIGKPHAITLPSDQVAFVQFGIPVMVFYSTHPVEYPEVFEGDVLHTANDSLDFLLENHPGRVERALSEFGLFLEEVVSHEFVQ